MPFSVIEDLTNGICESENIEKYDAYLTNMYFSMFPDTLFFANLMNQYADLPKSVQYEFYLNSIRASKRYTGKWPKRKPNEDLDFLRETFGYSIKKAKEALVIMSKDQINGIKNKKGD